MHEASHGGPTPLHPNEEMHESHGGPTPLHPNEEMQIALLEAGHDLPSLTFTIVLRVVGRDTGRRAKEVADNVYRHGSSMLQHELHRMSPVFSTASFEVRGYPKLGKLGRSPQRNLV